MLRPRTHHVDHVTQCSHDPHSWGTMAWTYPWWGAAGPLRGGDPTARVSLGAAKLSGAVTRHVVVVLCWVGPYHFTLRDGEDEHVVALLLAGSRLHVAGVTLRTAVLVVLAANGLKRRHKHQTWCEICADSSSGETSLNMRCFTGCCLTEKSQSNIPDTNRLHPTNSWFKFLLRFIYFIWNIFRASFATCNVCLKTFVSNVSVLSCLFLFFSMERQKKRIGTL